MTVLVEATFRNPAELFFYIAFRLKLEYCDVVCYGELTTESQLQIELVLNLYILLKFSK